MAYINGDEVNNTFTGVAKESVSSSYDLARYSRGNFVVTRTFYYDWTFKRYVYDWGTYSNIGDRICRFGRKTGATCSHVKQVGAVGTGDDGRTYYDLTVMEDRQAAGGDSGGPWYYGNRAWGIHHGAYQKTWDSFTPAADLSSALGGYYVWTAPVGS
ncbi:hypothetical protein [Microbispora sp. CSR-4]|uniref:hypothetical protein n=1 Tax=Microbispora sp. CSR-4 TaxID=2592813 RepID=UPI0011CC4522|nr:hypothetical protein [Microbispora sp. CSR-4]